MEKLDYDKSVARSYHQFRPPLHSLILSALIGNERYEWALDVGCGTGISTEPLLKYSDKVIGIDRSESMIGYAKKNSDISFSVSDNPTDFFPTIENSIITLAGVIAYLTPDEIVNLIQSMYSESHLLIYDFKVDFNHLENYFEFPPSRREYNPALHLDHYISKTFIKRKAVHFIEYFDCNKKQLASLIKGEGCKESNTNIIQLLDDIYLSPILKCSAECHGYLYEKGQ